MSTLLIESLKLSKRCSLIQHRQVSSLPLISVLRFSCKPTDCTTFSDYFTSLIIYNRVLDNLQKLHCLKWSVEGEVNLVNKKYTINRE